MLRSVLCSVLPSRLWSLYFAGECLKNFVPSATQFKLKSDEFWVILFLVEVLFKFFFSVMPSNAFHPNINELTS